MRLEDDGFKRTAAQTEDLDVVARLRRRQGEERGGEEHGFVVRVGDEEADALVAEAGEGRPYDLRGVQPCCREDDRDGEGEVGFHALLLLPFMKLVYNWFAGHFLM